MGGCTLIVTLSMCITFSIRRKTWLTLHCSIKQLCISAQSLLICNVFIVSLFSFPPPTPGLRLSYLTSYSLKEQGVWLVMISTYHTCYHSFTWLQVRNPDMSQNYKLGILLVPIIPVKMYIPSHSLIMRNKTNTVVTLVLCASVFVPCSSMSGVIMPVWWVSALYINSPKLVRLFIWKWSLNVKCKG